MLTLTSRFPRFLQAIIWLQLVADAPPSAVGAGGEAARELAGDGESQTLLSDVDGGGGGGYDVVREMEVLEAAVVNGRRAQVCCVAADARACIAAFQLDFIFPRFSLARSSPATLKRMSDAARAVLRSCEMVAAPLLLGRPQPELDARAPPHTRPQFPAITSFRSWPCSRWFSLQQLCSPVSSCPSPSRSPAPLRFPRVFWRSRYWRWARRHRIALSTSSPASESCVRRARQSGSAAAWVLAARRVARDLACRGAAEAEEEGSGSRQSMVLNSCVGSQVCGPAL